MKILSVILFSAFAAVLLSSAKAEARPEAEYGPWGPFWVFSPDWTCPEEQYYKNADFFRAVAFDLRDRVQVLLDCGADIDVRNTYGQTPLHWAMYLEDPWMTNFLIDRGADPSARSRDGLTAEVSAKINWHRKTSRTCADNEEVNPFNVRECRPRFSCPGELKEIAENVCECPNGRQENPFHPGTCRQPFSCPSGQTEVAENICECPSEVPHYVSGACSSEPYSAVRSYDFSECPDGEYNVACRMAVWDARFARELVSSPVSQIKGIERAISLGLSGAGVTVGVGEQSSPYWEDKCTTGLSFGGFFLPPGYVVPLSSPNEEVPARYANYENGECDRGLIRTHSDLPSIRVLDDSKPRASNRVRANSHIMHIVPVFGVMAAQRDSYGVVGVAPGADYVYADSHTYDWDESPDVEIVNYSVYGGMPITSHAVVDGEGKTLTMATRTNLSRPDALQQWWHHLSLTLRLEHVNTHASADRRINVVAAGNESYSELNAFSGMPLYFPELRGNNLAVVAIGRKGGRIEDYSNRCGLAGASFCLAAPVRGFIIRPDIDFERFDISRGTSIASPVVAGALALVKEYFNRMGGIGNDELVRRILETADKSGKYADESIYGAGVVDLENALTPQGELQLLSGRSVSDSESHSLSASGLRTGAAFGDSIGKSLEGVQIAAFDELNAPFPVDAAGLIQSEWESDSLRDALLAFQFGETTAPKSQWDFANGFGWWSLRGGSRAGQPEIKSIFGADDAYANPYSALAGDGMSAGLEWDSLRVAMFGETPGRETLARGAVGSFSFAPLSETTENGGWIFHFGGVDELNGFLSSSGSGAFGDLRSRTAFVGADYVGEKMNGWRIRLGGFAGDTSAENGEWFAGTESLRSDSFHLGVERENIFYSDDGLGFRLHQPLRASGSLKIRIPTGRTRYGDLTWREVSGKTSGRELALEGLYRRSFDGGSWRVSAGAVSEPGHRAEAKTIGRMLFAFEREF